MKAKFMQPMENIGRMVLEKRGDRGVRAVAEEIGISHATLSRVERGFLPELATYQKICRWLGIDTPTMATTTQSDTPQVHFRRERTITPEAAQALAHMILKAQDAWGIHERSEEQE